jgi:hypothetical protein
MRLFEGRVPGVFLGWILLATVILCGGCQTPKPLFNATGPGWRLQEGQALWRPRRQMPELGGDLVLASDADGRCLVQFNKTPMSLVVAQTTHTSWLVQFPPRQMGFSGHGRRPTRFLWLYLQPALAGEALPAPLRFQRQPNGLWRLENTRSGETLEGFLAP